MGAILNKKHTDTEHRPLTEVESMPGVPSVTRLICVEEEGCEDEQ